jgi:hypothetical protein
MANWDEGFWDDGFWDSPSSVATTLPDKQHKLNRRIMASNPTPDDDAVLRSLAEDLADGCHAHEVSIGIKQNTEAVIRAALSAHKASRTALAAANGVQAQARALRDAKDVETTAVLRNCRLRLLKLFGSAPSADWEVAGFVNGTTAVPDSRDGRFDLLGALRDYFTAHPTAESADMDATAAICGALHTASSNARAALNGAASAQTTAMALRDTDLRTLRKRVRGLLEELGTLLADDDERYEAFGLNIPANPAAPEPITSVTLAANGGGKVFAQWGYTTRMVSTRLLTLRVGTDTEFQNAGTVDGLEKMLTGFTPGITLQVKAIAYNDGGDAPESPVASVVVS